MSIFVERSPQVKCRFTNFREKYLNEDMMATLTFSNYNFVGPSKQFYIPCYQLLFYMCSRSTTFTIFTIFTIILASFPSSEPWDYRWHLPAHWVFQTARLLSPWDVIIRQVEASHWIPWFFFGVSILVFWVWEIESNKKSWLHMTSNLSLWSLVTMSGCRGIVKAWTRMLIFCSIRTTSHRKQAHLGVLAMLNARIHRRRNLFVFASTVATFPPKKKRRKRTCFDTNYVPFNDSSGSWTKSEWQCCLPISLLSFVRLRIRNHHLWHDVWHGWRRQDLTHPNPQSLRMEARKQFLLQPGAVETASVWCETHSCIMT